MNVTLPENLRGFVEKQVCAGKYADADAFVEHLVRTEAELLERVNNGEALPVDEHFERRLDTLLDEAEQSGDYVEVSKEDFDALESEALKILRGRQPF